MQAASTEYLTTLFSIIDFGNLMTYDVRGAWDTLSGHHTSLYSHPSGNPDADALDFSADALVSYLLGKSTDSKGSPLRATLSKGVPAGKVVIGAAFYTRGWEQVASNGADPAYPGLLAATAKVNKDADSSATAGAENAVAAELGNGGRLGGVWPYGKLTALTAKYPGLTYYYDEIAEAPYLYSTAGGGAFFTYDSPRSIAAKALYVKKMGLGGVISWMASDDAYSGGEETGEYGPKQERSVLTRAIKEGLFGTAPLEQFVIGAPQLDVGAVVSVSTVNGKLAFNIDVTNRFVNNEANMALGMSAKAANTLAAPKLYITLKDGVTVGNGSAYGSGTWTQTGNLVVDDLSTTYELKTLDIGETANIVLPTAATTLGASDIVRIEISKHIYPNGPEVGRTVVYEG